MNFGCAHIFSLFSSSFLHSAHSVLCILYNPKLIQKKRREEKKRHTQIENCLHKAPIPIIVSVKIHFPFGFVSFFLLFYFFFLSLSPSLFLVLCFFQIILEGGWGWWWWLYFLTICTDSNNIRYKLKAPPSHFHWISVHLVTFMCIFFSPSLFLICCTYSKER